jgi:ribonuclease P protein component
LNKHLLLETIERPYAIMLFYQTKDAMTFVDMNQKAIQLFEKFILEIKK